MLPLEHYEDSEPTQIVHTSNAAISNESNEECNARLKWMEEFIEPQVLIENYNIFMRVVSLRESVVIPRRFRNVLHPGRWDECAQCLRQRLHEIEIQQRYSSDPSLRQTQNYLQQR